MGLFSKLVKSARKGIPGRDSGGGMGSAMARPAAPRPTLVQGGPAYFTPEGYTPPMQPQQAFMPTDTMGDPIGDMFRAQPPLRSIPGPPPMPPRDITPPPIMCFVAGTKIDMADGTKKVIENIAMGDEVLALNGETDVVSYVHDIPKADRSLWTINDRITATDAHAFLTNDGWKSNNSKLSNTVYNDYGIEVKELQLGDKLITKDGVEEVTKLESKKDFIKVYNFTTSNTHTYMVDGVVSHNKMPPMPPFTGREEPPIMVEDPSVDETPMDIPMDNMMIDRPMISGLENPNLFNFDFSNIDMDAINQRIADAGGTIPQEPQRSIPTQPSLKEIINAPTRRGRDDFMSIGGPRGGVPDPRLDEGVSFLGGSPTFNEQVSGVAGNAFNQDFINKYQGTNQQGMRIADQIPIDENEYRPTPRPSIGGAGGGFPPKLPPNEIPIDITNMGQSLLDSYDAGLSNLGPIDREIRQIARDRRTQEPVSLPITPPPPLQSPADDPLLRPRVDAIGNQQPIPQVPLPPQDFGFGPGIMPPTPDFLPEEMPMMPNPMPMPMQPRMPMPAPIATPMPMSPIDLPRLDQQELDSMDRQMSISRDFMPSRNLSLANKPMLMPLESRMPMMPRRRGR
jgi:hypothetical protein